jgi:hypothetical protein
VTEEVYASVDQVDPSLTQPEIDRPGPEANLQQLLAGDQAMLPPRALGSRALPAANKVVNAHLVAIRPTVFTSTLDINVNPTRAPGATATCTLTTSGGHRPRLQRPGDNHHTPAPAHPSPYLPNPTSAPPSRPRQTTNASAGLPYLPNDLPNATPAAPNRPGIDSNARATERSRHRAPPRPAPWS